MEVSLIAGSCKWMGGGHPSADLAQPSESTIGCQTTNKLNQTTLETKHVTANNLAQTTSPSQTAFLLSWCDFFFCKVDHLSCCCLASVLGLPYVTLSIALASPAIRDAMHRNCIWFLLHCILHLHCIALCCVVSYPLVVHLNSLLVSGASPPWSTVQGTLWWVGG